MKRNNVLNKIHFISGLPRSGSTLLSAILRQNPRFQAGITSPVITLVNAVQSKMNGGEFGLFFNDACRKRILLAIFESYYDVSFANNYKNSVIFDTNRSWTSKAALTRTLFNESKIICCVRNISWILDSIERMLEKNPLQLSRMFNFLPGANIAARTDILMNPEKGQVGSAWSTLRDAWYSEESGRLILIPYESLVINPAKIIDELYDELREPRYAHDFDSVHYEDADFDRQIGMPGLHSVRKTIDYKERPTILPPDIFNKFSAFNFWNDPVNNRRGVKILG